MADVEIRLHPIPEPGQPALHRRARSGPASVVLRERRLQDRAHEPRQRQLRRVRYPTPDARPIGITLAADGALWFCQNAGNRIGRITTTGAITEFPCHGWRRTGRHRGGPTAMCGSRKRTLSRVGRITPDGQVTEFSKGLTPGCRPLSPVVRNGDIWFSEYEAGQIGRITMDGHVTEYPIPTPNSEPRAMVDASGRPHMVRRDQGQRARPHRRAGPRHRMAGQDAGRVAARRHRGARRRSLVHGEFRQQDRPHGA